jgi:hypothetical protein
MVTLVYGDHVDVILVQHYIPLPLCLFRVKRV